MSREDQPADQKVSETIRTNSVVSFHYRLCEVESKGNRTDWLEESFGREPLKYLHGYHNVIVGLENALSGKTVGDLVSIALKPEEAYGPRLPDAIQRVPIKHLKIPQGQKNLLPGMIVSVQTDRGFKQVIVAKVGKFNVDVDFNHPLAGKNLYYEVEVVNIRDASPEEIAHGHAHGPGGHQH